MHPLARGAGGDPFHGGGKHWESQTDPEWQTLAAWVKGATTLAVTIEDDRRINDAPAHAASCHAHWC